MRRILFIPFLFLFLAFYFTSPAWASGLDDEQAGKTAFQRGNNEEAIRLLTRAIASGELSQKNLIRAYINRGNAWFSKSDYDKAIADFTKAIEIDPKDADAHYNRGVAWQRKSDYNKAIADFTKAIEIDPKDADAYHSRGFAWEEKGDLAKAIADYTKAIEINPKNADAYRDRGSAWGKKGDCNKAIGDLTKAIEINPKDAYAYNNRGNAWYRKGDPDAYYPSYNQVLGIVWRKNEDNVKAILDYTKAIEINPKYASAYYGRGNAWYTKGDYDKAILDYTKAIEINPRNADAYYGRGLAWGKKSNHGKVIADCTKAIEIDPKYANAYSCLAWIMATCLDGRYRDGKQAVKFAEKALKLEETPWTMASLAAAYAEAGRFQEAVQTQERAITKLKQAGATKYLSQFTELLSSYKAGKPWRKNLI
jgi:tetratricopeptide (TPR) repeat protein